MSLTRKRTNKKNGKTILKSRNKCKSKKAKCTSRKIRKIRGGGNYSELNKKEITEADIPVIQGSDEYKKMVEYVFDSSGKQPLNVTNFDENIFNSIFDYDDCDNSIDSMHELAKEKLKNIHDEYVKFLDEENKESSFKNIKDSSFGRSRFLKFTFELKLNEYIENQKDICKQNNVSKEILIKKMKIDLIYFLKLLKDKLSLLKEKLIEIIKQTPKNKSILGRISSFIPLALN